MPPDAATSQTPSSSSMRWTDQALIGLCVCMTLSFNLGPWLSTKTKPLFISPFDLLLPIFLLLLLWQCLRDARATGLKAACADYFPPAANLCWFFLALASLRLIPAEAFNEGLKSVLTQAGFTGLLGVWFFASYLRKRSAADVGNVYRNCLLALGLATTACFLWGLLQYVRPGALLNPGESVSFAQGYSIYRVAGWFEFRGQLAGFIAMQVPACFAFAALERDHAYRMVAVVLGATGLCVCLYGGGFLAACVGVLGVSVLLYIKKELPTENGRCTTTTLPALALLGILLLMVLVLIPLLPRQNIALLWESLSPFRSLPSDADVERPSAALRQYQAMLNLLKHRDQWPSGVGAGQFQKQINRYYQSNYYPKPARQTDDEPAFGVEADEPYTFGLFQTTLVELGLPGAALLLLVFFHWGFSALRAYLLSDDPTRAMLALVSFAAALGATIFIFYGSPLLRGCGAAFAFFMGMALQLDKLTDKPVLNKDNP